MLLRSGVEPWTPEALTVTVSVCATRMSPCVPAPTKQRDDEQYAPLSAIADAFWAVGEPPIGLPCPAKLAPAFVVPMIRLFPSAMHDDAFEHATPLSAVVVPLVSGVGPLAMFGNFRIVPAAPT